MTNSRGTPFAALTGVILGAMHSLVLWASLSQFGFVSELLYRDHYRLAFQITAVVDIASLAIILTSTYWLPFMMKLQQEYEYLGRP